MKSKQDILSSGYSRIPVYNRKDKQHILGFLLAKSLIVVDPTQRQSLRSLSLREPLVITPSLSLLVMLKKFRAGHSHIAFVSEHPDSALECIRKGVKPPLEAKFLVSSEDIAVVTPPPSSPSKLNSPSSHVVTIHLHDSDHHPYHTTNNHNNVSPFSKIDTIQLTRRKAAMVGSMTGTIRFAKPNYDITSTTKWDSLLQEQKQHHFSYDNDDDNRDIEQQYSKSFCADTCRILRERTAAERISFAAVSKRHKSTGSVFSRTDPNLNSNSINNNNNDIFTSRLKTVIDGVFFGSTNPVSSVTNLVAPRVYNDRPIQAIHTLVVVVKLFYILFLEQRFNSFAYSWLLSSLEAW
eukprot:gene1029-2017_t